MRKGNGHITAFYLETLLMILVFVGVILVLTQFFGIGDKTPGRAAGQLVNLAVALKGVHGKAERQLRPGAQQGTEHHLLLTGKVDKAVHIYFPAGKKPALINLPGKQREPVSRVCPAVCHHRVIGLQHKRHVLQLVTKTAGAVLGGFLFKEIFWGPLGFIFGFVCGLLLTFMLMNVLLSRSVRQMFRGLRVLLVFALALIVVVFGICWAYTYRDDHVFAANRVKSVSIREYSGYDPIYGEITDPAAIALTSAYLEAYFACADGDSVSYTLGDAGKTALEIVRSMGEDRPNGEIAIVEIDNDKMIAERFSRTRNVWLSQTVAGGLSHSWRVTFGQYPELEELEAAVCRAITDSESFKTHYVEIFEQGAADIVHFIRGYTHGQSIREDGAEYQAMLAELREQIGYDFFQRQQIGSLEIRIDRRYYTFPVYEGQPALIKMLGYANEEEMRAAQFEEFREWFEKTEDFRFTVYKRSKDGSVRAAYYEPENSETVWMESAVLASFSEPSIFTRVSSEYSVGTVDWEPVYFLHGKEPQFILDLFE